MTDVVPIHALTSRDERFGCTRLRAVLSGETCLARQARAAEAKTYGERQDTSTCTGCPVGAEVRARVGHLPERPAPDARATHHRAALAEAMARKARHAATDATEAERALARRQGGSNAVDETQRSEVTDVVTKQTIETCTHPDGCSNPRGRVVLDGARRTHPDRTTWCVVHRNRAGQQDYYRSKHPGAAPVGLRATPSKATVPARRPRAVRPVELPTADDVRAIRKRIDDEAAAREAAEPLRWLAEMFRRGDVPDHVPHTGGVGLAAATLIAERLHAARFDFDVEAFPGAADSYVVRVRLPGAEPAA